MPCDEARVLQTLEMPQGGGPGHASCLRDLTCAEWATDATQEIQDPHRTRRERVSNFGERGELGQRVDRVREGGIDFGGIQARPVTVLTAERVGLTRSRRRVGVRARGDGPGRSGPRSSRRGPRA
ncbi:hypothetical protein CPE01_20290 [Cellulomonas persica]|uniref:Uncharacterized protein n=1 Tax=Cellulomonas persica TaxID=76861 RepID=A0A510UUX2_9CELL|nr:hypothetical protein CPE01_20290 [Cellulomonas persica]